MADSLLIKNALVVPTGGGAAPFVGWVSVQGDLIDEVAPGAPPQRAFARVIDAGGGPLIPGLINTHAHSHSSLTRGTAERLPLEAWLEIIYREARRLDDDIAYCAALVTFAESLLSGTTTIMDMCINPEAAARAADTIGIRAIIAPYVGDRLDFAPTLARTEALIERYNGKGGRVGVWIGLHESETCSDAQIRDGVKLAERHGVGLHTHCSETQASLALTRRRTGRSQVGHLDNLGALGPQTLLAHCVWLSDEDRAILVKRGTHIAHCPHSNLKLGSGIAPIPKYRADGINVSLASDGAKSNNALDQFDAMKFASLLPKGVNLDPDVLPPGDVLDMATWHGAQALGLKTGRIAPGYKADLTLLRGNVVRLQPVLPQTILTNLVHAARGGDVDTVVVDGRIVVEKGRLAALDEAELAIRARDTALRLMAN
ncbi:MAG TPA: amidohydrolase [Alphaproteobacteria bacterium]